MAGALGRAAGREAVSGFMDLATRQASNKARKTAARKASKVRRKENLEDWFTEGDFRYGRIFGAKDLGSNTRVGKTSGEFSAYRKPQRTVDSSFRKQTGGDLNMIDDLPDEAFDALRPIENRAQKLGLAKAFSRKETADLSRLSANDPFGISDEHIRAYRAAQNMIPDRLDDFVAAAGKMDMPLRELLEFFVMGVF